MAPHALGTNSTLQHWFFQKLWPSRLSLTGKWHLSPSKSGGSGSGGWERRKGVKRQIKPLKVNLLDVCITQEMGYAKGEFPFAEIGRGNGSPFINRILVSALSFRSYGISWFPFCPAVLGRSPLRKEECVHVCVLIFVELFVVPWAVAHQALLSMGLSRQEYWSGLPCLSPGDLTNPGIAPCLLRLLHCGWVLYHRATREAPLKEERWC